MGIMTYSQAACLALREEMRRDKSVWALGEDLGPEGGVAGQYRGLQDEFGPQRIVDTPISESTIMGSAVGAAIAGTRPVVELRYCDFGLCAADEIINQAAKLRYMLGGQVRMPVVIRQTIGIRAGLAAQHSQSTEAFWVHTPGLVVVAPATARDNRALLKSSIRCDDPVVFMEHKELWTVEDVVPDEEEVAEIGKGQIAKPGTDPTIVAWSKGVTWSLEAADLLQSEGISAEVIDLRTLYPWDHGLVLESVAKTGHLLVPQEAPQVGGFGAEVVAYVVQHGFRSLKAPPVRVGGPRVPIPFAETLEKMARLDAQKIAKAAGDMLRERSAA
jgi:pyruvate dehydrogenase E1 component beta subunit